MKRVLGLLLLGGCATTPPSQPVTPEPPSELVTPPIEPAETAEGRQAAMRAVVEQFLAATEARQFEQVLPLLAKPLRDRYSVENLARDFGADPLAAARLGEIKKKLAGAFADEHDAAALEWAQGRALRLVQEADGWRISSLE